MRLLPAFLACLALAASAPAALAQAPTEDLDHGSFIINIHDHAIGAETFGIEGRADSLNCAAHSYRTQHTSQGDEPIAKTMVLTAGRGDWALRYYQSEETFRGQTLVRGVVMDPGDTSFTVFVERKEGGGTANRRVAPPGRTFVLDSGLYTLFDLICLHLHGKTFTTRPLNLLVFGPRDTLLEAEVTDLGTETIRWGARPVQAHKLKLTDGTTTFLVWAHPSGRMVRLTHEGTGLRVDRQPPPVKRRSAPPPKPGG